MHYYKNERFEFNAVKQYIDKQVAIMVTPDFLKVRADTGRQKSGAVGLRAIKIFKAQAS